MVVAATIALQLEMLPLQALPWKDEIVAVGLARGIPNFKGEKHQHAEFKEVIERCRSLGWQITAHVGEHADPAVRHFLVLDGGVGSVCSAFPAATQTPGHLEMFRA